ncbi:Pogo transposable element with KRAB domainlike [Phytophthora palmivora]|uniref:Pogo transposable element with KRAB domainlike n=1 Tax=Phytophthora palmivora TaxID=4796 RepID=A0A2P4XH32_9STRA|nr:Pogo transposable element with KRAB domainlike [Phytophthora palmivora]
MRIAAILAVTASGRKLPPVLIRKSVLVWIAPFSNGGSICKFPQVAISEGKFLVWDSMRGHISHEVKTECQSRGIGLCVIPGGLTPYLQAGDIAIYRSFCALRRTCGKKAGTFSAQRVGIQDLRPSQLCVAGVACFRERNGVEIDPSSGFSSNPYGWFIVRYDVYGKRFLYHWPKPRGDSEADVFNFDEIDDALDDVTIFHEE